MEPFSTFGDTRRRRRQRLLWRLVRLALVIGLFALGVAYAYQVGLSQKTAEVARLQTDIDELREANQVLSARAAQALQQAERARRQTQEVRAYYEREAEANELGDILELIQDKLDAGVPLDRLAFVVGAVTEGRDCDPPQTRRFLVRTPLGTDAASTVAFAEGRITVTGEGTSARNPQGLIEAWFDAAEPVQLRFTRLGGEVETASGVLPVTHSLVVDGREWRFSARPGEQRGFVEITAQGCAWP